MSAGISAAEGRIPNLDVLRGLGVMGILAVNAAAFAMPFAAYSNPLMAPFPFEGLSAQLWWVVHVFFERKFVTLFSLLFGASIFLVGGERRDPVRSPILKRRLLWLAVFGVLHGVFLWYGDILLLYAISGFVVLLCRSWKPRTLIVVGALLFFLFSAAFIGMTMGMRFMPPEELAKTEAAMWTVPAAELQKVIANMQGGLVSAWKQNLENWVSLQGFSIFFTPCTIALMLVGMGLFKTGVLQGRGPVWLYLLLIAAGAGSLWVIAQQASEHMTAGFPFPAVLAEGSAANGLLSPFVTLAYVSVVALGMKLGLVGAVLKLLAPVGRMAFTNYLMQSLIMTTIFWGGRGFGYFGELDRPAQLSIVAGVWVFQIVFSNLWLRMFSQGPLEAIWRKLSYGKAGRPERLAV